MNKKGFTLVELIAIIVILGVVLVIAIPTVSNIVENSRIESFNKSEVTMIEAAKGYMLLNTKYIPANIGDTTEITVEEMQANKTLGVIVNPWNESEKCSGYVLTTKVADKEYTYHPYLNCDNNIGSSADDKLLARYTFDDFQEPTENLLSGYLTRMTGRTGSKVTLEQNYSFKEYGIDNATRVIISGINSTSTTPSATTIVSNTLNEGRTFTTTVKVKNIGVNDVCISNNLGDNTWIKPGEVKEVIQTNIGRGPGTSHYMFNIRTRNTTDDLDFILYELQSEEKGHATPYIENSREGRITDYSLNNNHADIQLSNTPKWSKASMQGYGAYEFDGVDDSIKIPLSIGTALHGSNFTLSAIVKSNGMAEGMSLAGVLSINYGLTMSLTSDGNLSLRTDTGTAIISTATTGINLHDNKFHMITATYDGGYVRLYVDGVKKQEAAREWNNRYHTSDVGGIGFETNNPPVYRYKGIIDDVRIYK
ncbi:MAG TPA: prepilin-type N-terminal cleavage/methylation domain-containing protein, partial [Mollicutes bacterium]|nr:prepilin-type N-terminal cleavage/methylation domain-containing protein [Mollicutes bacterium]